MPRPRARAGKIHKGQRPGYAAPRRLVGRTGADVVGLSAFLIYRTWAAFRGNYFEIRRDRAHFDRQPRSRALPVTLLCFR